MRTASLHVQTPMWTAGVISGRDEGGSNSVRSCAKASTTRKAVCAAAIASAAAIARFNLDVRVDSGESK